ncbi:MAG: hypothetical protein ACW99U_18165 [Candidatus Thorarchaeota archaeon]|jgi:hypothetical protein
MADEVTTIVPGTLKSNKDQVLARIGDLRRKDPKLYESLKLIVEGLDAVTIQLNPIIEVTDRAQAAQELPPPITLFGYSLSTTAVNLTWTAPNPIGSTVFYEIRKGTVWETATFVLRTPSLGCALDPHTVGNHDYMIKTLNGLGDESTNSLSTQVVIPAIGTPSVSAQVIDNNVLLTWTEPTSTFLIDYYEILKDSVVQGENSGTFMSLFESTAGTYTYGVIAYDVAGNNSAEGQISAIVDEPPDFELHSELTFDLTAGTHTANQSWYQAEDGYIYGPAELTEQYATHFTSQGWSSPNDQVAAGHSLYIQENPLTAVWTSAEMDIGSAVKNVICNFTYVNENVPTTTNPTWLVEMRLATAPGVGAFTAGASQFSAEVRYVTVRVTITAAGAAPRDSMGRFNNVNVAVTVKNVVDGNNIVCDATDTEGDAGEEGTIVMFPRNAGYAAGGGAASGHATKDFSDITSITLAPLDTLDQAVTAIYDFVDVADPEYFTILCFDSAGRRADATVGWKVRGVKT